MQRKEFILIGIVLIALVILAIAGDFGLFGSPFGSPAMTQPGTGTVTSTIPAFDTSTWKKYSSREFGFSFQYPAAWQKSNDPLTVVNPHIFFGNPLNGTTTYHVSVFVYDNPRNLSAADYVAAMLAADRAQDASASAQAPAPQTTPKYSKEFAITVGPTSTAISAYELYDVFEFDHDGEQVYVQQNKKMLVFDFPVNEANPNIADPAGNNAVAHEILATLSVDPNVWKFCGGIAAGQFQCAKGYSCKLDGNYPDAGGHCVAE